MLSARKFIPALLGRTVNDLQRELFSLPARFAGLGIANPCTQSEKQFKNSEELAAPLLELILAQDRKLNAKHMRRRIVFGKYKKIRQRQIWTDNFAKSKDKPPMN